MGITFAPRRGAILTCDFGPDPSDPAAQVCHGRLDRVLAGRSFIQEDMTAIDLALVESGIKAAFNI